MRNMPRVAAGVLLAAAVLAGCSPGRSRGGPAPASKASVIDGQWSYRGVGRTSLELELWQAGSGDSLAGRVVHWMSGDVGQDTRSLTLSGAIQGHTVWFVIPLPATAVPVRIEGTVRGDTLVITKATTGGDDNGLTGGRFVRTGPLTR